MNASHLLNKLAAKNISRDEARVLLSLSSRGKTTKELASESPGLCPKVPARMVGHALKRQKHGRGFVYRLTETGMLLARMIFDEETTPPAESGTDTPTFPQL
jgi:hypothetical protein